jgi:hypothetical protein
MPDLAGLADRVRRLATQNDPDVLRAGLAEIVAALEAASIRLTVSYAVTEDCGPTV